MMLKGDYYSKWLRTLEKNREIIRCEFSSLSAVQLNYHVHIHNCSIVEILNNLVRIQNKVIPKIDGHMDKLEKTTFRVAYQPGYFSGFLIRLSPGLTCKTGNNVLISSIGELTGELSGQNMKLENLVHQSVQYNINNRIIRFGYMNIWRVSMGDLFDMVTKCQQKHIVLARRILMLQNL
ncbi:MAG TPA: hypothetical protein VK179_07025 [Bacteroidales bacterium]|nr:hypothetical protein [Bacteroidales bacterium]